jgi:glycosyltransferase involved in cell wall biosynthesis
MTTHRMSVAMCTYNGARFLQQQLDSIAQQRRLPDELVICDDRSSDATMTIIEEFASRATFPVRHYRNDQNIGATKNFERAITLCSGSIVALSDQDDVWHPDKLAQIGAFFADNPRQLVVFTDAEVVDQYLRPVGYQLWQTVQFGRARRKQLLHGKAVQVLLKRNVVTGATMAFRSGLQDLILPIPRTWIHDGWIALLAASVAPVGLIEQPLIQYRQHSEQQVGSTRYGVGVEWSMANQTAATAYLQMAGQYEAALERLATHRKTAGQAHVHAQVAAKVLHLRARAHIATLGLSRISRTLHELASGRYFRYSNGWKSFAKDLLLPKNPMV